MATGEFWIKVSIFTVALVMPFGILALLIYAGRRLRSRRAGVAAAPSPVSTRQSAPLRLPLRSVAAVHGR